MAHCWLLHGLPPSFHAFVVSSTHFRMYFILLAMGISSLLKTSLLRHLQRFQHVITIASDHSPPQIPTCFRLKFFSIQSFEFKVKKPLINLHWEKQDHIRFDAGQSCIAWSASSTTPRQLKNSGLKIYEDCYSKHVAMNF